MLSIVLLGTGNVAHHLFNAFQTSDTANVIQVYGRTPKKLEHFSTNCATTMTIQGLLEADLYLIAVSDNAIASISASLRSKKGIVAHTSGSVAMALISSERKAVFYPLQTFTKGKKTDFAHIPICIEASVQNDLEILKALGESISASVHQISSLQRRKLHLAAVLVNNFTNHLYGIADDICETEALSFNLLKPLIIETAEKIMELTPKEAQTGPARRNDIETMQQHLELLDKPIQKKIYQLLSESIKASYD
ncbi:Rossmann-like and DUF2520 domain-containing protein [uncultured Croceitalea sp.]|uniref:Rossmann-like and DUF2520 domain-containing protein n=1 Tax=uncultured Croceitalea sp. TaxID=1798908 RepID=UPI00330626C4